MFCDVCGIVFEKGDLLPRSRYCHGCGEELLKWMVALATSSSRLKPVEQNADAEDDEDDENYGVPPRFPSPGLMSPGTLESSHSRTVSHSPSPSPSIASASEFSPSVENSPEPTSTSMTTSATLSLNITDYDLPPPFPVPIRFNTPFPRRSVITKILGGNTQRTYPVSGDRRHPMYACPRMDHNPTIPRHQGHHGILITKPVPKELNTNNFSLFVKHLTESVWYYRGQYRIRHASHLTPAQWTRQSRKFRHERIQWIVANKDWGNKELRRLGLGITYDNARKAIERGDIKWEVKVMECIGFDTDLYGRLSALL
jgi:hypothetical protein